MPISSGRPAADPPACRGGYRLDYPHGRGG